HRVVAPTLLSRWDEARMVCPNPSRPYLSLALAVPTLTQNRLIDKIDKNYYSINYCFKKIFVSWQFLANPVPTRPYPVGAMGRGHYLETHPYIPTGRGLYLENPSQPVPWGGLNIYLTGS